MATEPNIGAVKIFGYLEKKGKMKVVTTWKKYWFVLEGRLLLYYRSREEYENLSPCKGSINMGLAINIRPGLATAGVLEIITRTNTITLRAKQRNIQEKWLQALMDASGQQQQQSSVSSPVKMTHFRYSMDNLIPPQTKAAQLTRQNTLPHRFNNNENSEFLVNKQIVTRLRQIGARSYGGSLDSIVKKQKQNKMQEKDEKYEKNDLYGQNENILVDNVEYITTNEGDKSDFNENNLLIENEEYLKCGDVEYYCTYEEINGGEKAVYAEPDLPPRPADDCRTGGERRTSDSEDGEARKMSAFSKFARKIRNFKANKKKKNEDEPIYDTVNYFEVGEIRMEAGAGPDDENIVKTLIDLKQKLEEKKLKVKDILESSASKTDEINEQKEDEEDSSDTPEVKIRPGLPPRTGTRTYDRSSSPYHDTPKNNSPVNPQTPDPSNIPSIDKILNDLEQEQNEELNVRQLIKKFNKIEPETSTDVSLRQKNDYQRISDDETSTIVNRYSEDLNKLLEELTKVTCAPLLTPGATSSLIQMKSPPVTDEEWLALTPIRRRRFSDPDYDVPRPHRSLQILAANTDDKEDEAIPATRFFGPVLSNTETWRSMTPDSLEPAHAHAQMQRKRAYTSADDETHDCFVYMDSLEPHSEGATAF